MSSFQSNTHLFLVILAACFISPSGELLESWIQITAALVWLTVVRPSGLQVCRVGCHLTHVMRVVICLVPCWILAICPLRRCGHCVGI